MAYLSIRLLGRSVRNRLAASSRFYSDKSAISSPAEVITGCEKTELSELQSGNEDPFRMRAIKRKPSSKTNPNIVESYYDCRIVGCVCEEDSGSIVWMWLFKGEPRRCQCGHWFKLAEYKPF